MTAGSPVRRLGVAAAAVLVLLTGFVPGSSGAWTVARANSGNAFSTGTWSSDYPTAVVADSPLHYFRLEEATSASYGHAAADSSGGNRPGRYAERTDAPLTYWRFNEGAGNGATTYDADGSVVGTLGAGAALTNAGKLNGGVTLNGTSAGYVSGSRTAVRTTESFTVSAWVKLTTTAAGSVVSQSGSAASGFDLQYTGTRWQFRIPAADTAAAADQVAYSASAASAGTWYHLVAVYDASLATGNMKLYVNNTAQAATGTNATPWNAGGALQAGRALAGGAWSADHLAGTTDEVRVFPRALTASEVNIMWNSGNGTESFYAQVLTARVPGALVGSGQTGTWGAGFGGKPNATPYNSISTNATYTTPNTFTVEAWFRTSTRNVGSNGIYTGGMLVGFTELMEGDSGTKKRDRLLFLGTAGHVGFGVDPGTPTTILSPNTYWDGDWHHAAASLGPAGMRLYVDGALVASNASVTTGSAFTGYWRVGGVQASAFTEYDTTSGYFTGGIDEVAIYGTQLSDARIGLHHAANS